MAGSVELIYRLLMAVDVENHPDREVREQLQVHEDLSAVLDAAAEQVGLDRPRWEKQKRGDGELAILPEEVGVAVVGDFVSALEERIAEINAARPVRPWLRIRLAIHHGTLTPGPFGPAGDAPIVISRLLAAPPVHRLLREREDLDVALVVSSTIYRNVIKTGFCSLDPRHFAPMQTTIKRVQYHGFTYRPPLRKSKGTTSEGAEIIVFNAS
ncbi:hypothetical protein DPM19_18510 [Actinomadura craniellae]|uniref:Uncharacterized protein n=1 Tax=Actinomadura craniellae TaxID=2231787 RepID=A0A365H3J3_9ACTN|nr:hypothetical protein [Actinomadura craniellae]RAY13661.1 hypothetical protein DPM19_18510 [Actinomadura craniellae]